MAALPLTELPEGIRVAVKLTPKASHDAVLGLGCDADGSTALRVAVTAPPEHGKANAALIKLLAKAWRIPKSSISIASGATSRHKTVLVAGERPAIRETLESWWEASDG